MGDFPRERFENCMSLWGNLLTLVVAFPLLLALLMCMLVLGCFYFLAVCFRVAFCGLVVENVNGEEGDSPEKGGSEEDRAVRMEEGNRV